MGLYFSAATFAQKAGWGIGAAVAGWMLAAFDFIPNVTQTATALLGIKLLISAIPGALYMSCGVFMFFYTIDSKMIEVMKQTLDARREQARGRTATG